MESGEDCASPDEVAMKKPLRPSQCRGFMRKELAKSFQEIVTGFIEQTKSGSCVHVKLANELLAEQPKRRGRKQNSPQSLMAKLLNSEGPTSGQQLE